MKYIARPVTVEASVIATVTPSAGEYMICTLADGTQRTATEEMLERFAYYSPLFETDGTRRTVTEEMLARMSPQPGDYWVEQSDGYQYLNPKDVFERKYKPATGKNMTFGAALDSLQFGSKVARSGWNGKGMWLAYSPGAKKLPAEKFWAGPNKAYAKQNGGTADVLPCITMKTATGEILMGWLASQSDMLADDWEIV